MKKTAISLSRVCTLLFLFFLLPHIAQSLSEYNASDKSSNTFFSRAEPAQAAAPRLLWTKLSNTKYTATDIKGNSYDIDALLQSGKKLLLDFSTIQCGACWWIHQSKILEKIQQEYKDELIVLWIEDNGSSVAEIEGKTGTSSLDWTDNGQFPIPIISDKQLARTIGVPVTATPYIVLVDSDGSFSRLNNRELLRISESWEENKVWIQELLDQCFKPNEKIKLSLGNSYNADNSRGISFDASVRSMEEMDFTYDWDFEGASSVKTAGKSAFAKWLVPGQYRVSLTVTAGNNRLTAQSTVTVSEAHTITQFPHFESFEKKLLDPTWLTIDADGNGKNWIELKKLYASLNPQNPFPTGEDVHSGNNCFSSWSITPTKQTVDGISGASIKTDHYLVSPQIHLPMEGEPEMQFFIASTSKQKPDAYSVLISTTRPVVDAFEQIKPSTVAKAGEKGMPESWDRIVLNLSPYKGKKVYVAIRHHDHGKNGIKVDDVTIGISGHVSTDKIDEQHEPQMTYIDGTVFIQGQGIQSVQLFDMNGRQIASAESSDSVQLKLPQQHREAYVVRIKTNHRIFTKKLLL